MMATLFEYVDESGQDTAGLFFVVSILITGAERDELGHLLEHIEKKSGKGILKWRKTSIAKREAYIRKLITSSRFVKKLFFEMFIDRKDYLALTAQAASDALRTQKGDKAIVFVDGLFRSQVPIFQKHLKPSARMKTKVKGVRRDENNAFIRLVDAICGLVRDAYTEQEWAQALVTKLKTKDILTEL